MKDSLFNITLDNLSGSMMLTLEPKEEIKINEFSCEMIKKTDVFGILKLNVTTINGEVKFNYDLSNKKSLAEFAKSGFNESYGKRILYNLCSAFLKLNEYYLKPNYCILNPEYTYIGDGLNVYLPYVPVKYMKTDDDELKQYFSELLSKYFAVEGISAYDEMFKYVYQCQTLDLSHFINKFLSSEEQSQNNFMANRQMAQANDASINNQNVVNQQLNNQQAQVSSKPMEQSAQRQNVRPEPPKMMQGGMKVPGAEVKIPGTGGMKIPGGAEIKMPGGGGIKMPGGNIPNNQNIEKKGLFGFGAKKPAPMQNQMPQSPNNMQNMKMPNSNMQNQNMPSNNMQNGNMNNFAMPNNINQNFNQPRFQNGFQGSMDKTIMMDNIGNQHQNMNNAATGAYLEYRGQNIPINDTEFVIGKANNQYKINFVINDNPHVSRKHASILTQGNNYYIRDEGSTNGTYVNGRSIPKMIPQPLQNGDEISIYDEVFRFCMR